MASAHDAIDVGAREGRAEGLSQAPPTAAETELLLAEVLVTSHKHILRRRTVQSWRLHLLRQDLTSRCAHIWRVTPTTHVMPTHHEHDVRRQLLNLAINSSCRAPFNSWLTFVQTAHREQLDSMRPLATAAMRSARASVNKLSTVSGRHSKLDAWISALSCREAKRSAWKHWRLTSGTWRNERAMSMKRCARMLHHWRDVRAMLALITRRPARWLRRARVRQVLCSLHAHVVREKQLLTAHCSVLACRGFRVWCRRHVNLISARATAWSAHRHHRRRLMHAFWHRWRLSGFSIARQQRANATARVQQTGSALWVAQVRRVISALRPCAGVDGLPLTAEALLPELQALGGAHENAAVLHHLISERRRWDTRESGSRIFFPCVYQAG